MRALLVALFFWPYLPASAGISNQVSAGEITVLDRSRSPVSRITDGDQMRLRIMLAEDVQEPLPFQFTLDGAGPTIANCTIPAGSDQCETEPFTSLGWHWQHGGKAASNRSIRASSAGQQMDLSTEIQVVTRPVVLVHGFSSSWEAWVNYLGPDGFLARTGLKGFAVGDGQVSGTMNTGSLVEPTRRTNTIAENATILGEYIANVKKATGAQQIDLISHSMGGLISRYYIDRVMPERDVAQLIMLGSPMAGTDCAELPVALGLYLPAALEIRPSYVQDIFNRQITHRHGVPFRALAGVPILEAFKSPCTEVPTDVAVSLQSVTAISLEAEQMPVLHTELNQSQQVFDEFVKPLLQTLPGGYPQEPDPTAVLPERERLQFTRVFSGHIQAGSSQEITIQIEPGVAVASFALYDTTRSLAVSVRGASGNVIELSPENNGLVVVDDPASLIYLGYGFQNPRPGTWDVNLLATNETPEGGADYALTAYFVGGADLNAQSSTLLPRVNEIVRFTASLDLGGQPVDLEEAEAEIRGPDGSVEAVPLGISAGQGEVDWKPKATGVYGVELRVAGLTADGSRVERTAFLTVEAQPREGLTGLAWGLSAAAILAVGLLSVVGLRKWRRARAP
jgi:pimeloyl-ACP methyl ester carboxylesterase